MDFAPHRRALLAGIGLSACATAARTEIERALIDSQPDETIALWPGAPPGGERVSITEQVTDRPNDLHLRDRIAIHVTRPTLSVFRPTHANGAALLIVPGGSYRHVVIDKEGFETARWFASRGVTCFVLRYRQPYDGWAAGPEAPLQDAQRAMRVIRAQAERLGVNPAKVAALGFSAGGHITASLAERYDAPLAPGVDAADALDAQPSLTALLYPVITMGASAHAGSRTNLLGEHPDAAALAHHSLELHAHARMTPTMLIQAADDETVPIANALLMFNALLAVGVKSELHAFEEGGHGFGLRFVGDKPVRLWPNTFLEWAQRHSWP